MVKQISKGFRTFTLHFLQGKARGVVLFLLYIIMLGVPSWAFAQSGLHTNAVFTGSVVPRSEIVEVKIRGKDISKYRLTFYHSVRFEANKRQFSQIEGLVAQDRRAAISVEDRSKGRGRSIILSLRPNGRIHRYLCFLAQGSGFGSKNVTIVYMEGYVSSIEDLRKLIK